jgi:hypothetical protein
VEGQVERRHENRTWQPQECSEGKAVILRIDANGKSASLLKSGGCGTSQGGTPIPVNNRESVRTRPYHRCQR